jgi:hypothetical protein
VEAKEFLYNAGGTTTIENSMEASQKTKNRTAI